MSKRMALSAREIEARLAGLADWHYQGNALERVYESPSYLDALARLNTIAHLSEAADHHPELLLGWRRLTIRYWTHTANGVTPLDFELAEKTERVLQTQTEPEARPDVM